MDAFNSPTVTSSDQERSCILLLRLQAAGGAWRWVHCVLQLKDAQDASVAANAATTNNTATTSGIATSSASVTATATSQSGQSAPTASQTVPPTGQSQQPIIVATNQVLSEREAAVLRGNSWLYHYYTMQSKLQYGLAYEAQRVHAYYPQVMPYQVSDSCMHLHLLLLDNVELSLITAPTVLITTPPLNRQQKRPLHTFRLIH